MGRGFCDIFPSDTLVCAGLQHRDITLLICGFADLDPEAWKTYTETAANLSAEKEAVISWFWELVEDMSSEDRAKMLHFATGSSRLPSEGFSGLSPAFNISIAGESELLPSSHTCGNGLVLPEYSSKDELAEKLRLALENDAGFGFA